MPRIFLGLASADALLLAAACALGRLGPIALATTALVHATAAAHLLVAERRVGALVRASGLPAWVEAQAIKNRRKASRFVLWGLAMAALAAWPGVAPPWHLAAASLALGFNLGAFAVEFLVIAAQSRLVRDVGAHEGPGRRMGREAVAAAEAVAR